MLKTSNHGNKNSPTLISDHTDLRLRMPLRTRSCFNGPVVSTREVISIREKIHSVNGLKSFSTTERSQEYRLFSQAFWVEIYCLSFSANSCNNDQLPQPRLTQFPIQIYTILYKMSYTPPNMGITSETHIGKMVEPWKGSSNKSKQQYAKLI